MRTLQPAKLIDYLQQTSSVIIHQRVAIKWKHGVVYCFILTYYVGLFYNFYYLK